MNVCVFCSASNFSKKYIEPAERLAKLMAEAGHTLVWGGSDYGLMKAVADGAKQGGGKIVGISMERFKDFARKDADEIIITKDPSERKAMLLERSDVVVMLVGGVGTLDEATEVLELRKEGFHNKVLIVLNTDGFYDGFKMQLQHIADEGFLPHGDQPGLEKQLLHELVQFVDTPEEAVALLGNET